MKLDAKEIARMRESVSNWPDSTMPIACKDFVQLLDVADAAIVIVGWSNRDSLSAMDRLFAALKGSDESN